MNFFSRRVVVSVLLLMVCLLVLMPLSPASSTTPMWSSTFSHSWGSWWNPSFTYSDWGSTRYPGFSYTHTWHASWTWRGTWTGTWHTRWATTWSGRTQFYPSYTWSQYVPSYTWTQYVPTAAPVPGCYPNYPYCNGYYPPGYVQTQTVTTSPPAPQTVVTQFVTQTLMVTQATSPGFFLAAWPSSVSLPPNDFIGSTNFVLNVTSVGGWSGQIQFTTSALPQGITLSNLPSTYQLSSPNVSWSVQVTIDASAKTGNYPLVITGLSGSLVNSATVTIDVSNPNA